MAVVVRSSESSSETGDATAARELALRQLGPPEDRTTLIRSFSESTLSDSLRSMLGRLLHDRVKIHGNFGASGPSVYATLVSLLALRLDYESRQQDMTKLPERNLDVLRACAVLSVWFSHLTQAAWHRGGTALGRLGVLAFFVHTALVLMSSIERAGGDDRRGWVWEFYFRRAARIYPLVWGTIALCVGANLAYSPTEIVGRRPSLEVIHAWQAITANVLLVQNVADLPNVIGPLWTLPIEMQMYLLLPAAYLLASRRGPATVLLTVVAAVLGAVALSVSRPAWLPRINVIGFAPCFLAGVWAYARLRPRERPARWPGAAWFAIVPLWWIAGLVVPITALPVAWAACLVLAGAIAATQELPASVVTRVAAQVAKYSYGIYLLHIPAWIIALRIEAPAAVQWMAYVVLLVAMPVASYHLIEAPAIRWMRRGEAPARRALRAPWLTPREGPLVQE